MRLSYLLRSFRAAFVSLTALLGLAGCSHLPHNHVDPKPLAPQSKAAFTIDETSFSGSDAHCAAKYYGAPGVLILEAVSLDSTTGHATGIGLEVHGSLVEGRTFNLETDTVAGYVFRQLDYFTMLDGRFTLEKVENASLTGKLVVRMQNLHSGSLHTLVADFTDLPLTLATGWQHDGHYGIRLPGDADSVSGKAAGRRYPGLNSLAVTGHPLWADFPEVTVALSHTDEISRGAFLLSDPRVSVSYNNTGGKGSTLGTGILLISVCATDRFSARILNPAERFYTTGVPNRMPQVSFYGVQLEQ